MTKQDLQRVLDMQVEGVHLSDDAVRNIRAAVYKEEKPVKRKMSLGMALVLILMMLSATALAASGGILELLGRLKGKEVNVLPGGEEMFTSESGPWQDEYVTYRVVGSAYDGHAAGVVIEVTPNDAGTLLLSSTCAAIRCWEMGDKPCNPPIQPLQEGELDDPVLKYARENGYRRVVLVNGFVSGFDRCIGYTEWQDNKLILFDSGAETRETIEGTFHLLSWPYQVGSVYRSAEKQQSMTIPFTMTAPAPLWQKVITLDAPLDVPDYGVRITQVTLMGTKLGVYADVHCEVTSTYLARRTLMEGTDEAGKFLGYGLLETTNYEIRPDETEHIFHATLPAMEEIPHTLRLQIRDVDQARETVFVEFDVK